MRVFSEGVPSPATMEQVHMISDNWGRRAIRLRGSWHGRLRLSMRHTSMHPRCGQRRWRVVMRSAKFVRLVPAFHPVLIFRRDRFLRGGDHSSFNAEGFAAVRFTEWQEKLRSSAPDTADRSGNAPEWDYRAD